MHTSAQTLSITGDARRKTRTARPTSHFRIAEVVGGITSGGTCTAGGDSIATTRSAHFAGDGVAGTVDASGLAGHARISTGTIANAVRVNDDAER